MKLEQEQGENSTGSICVDRKDQQFKEPTGHKPNVIARDFTRLQARDWSEELQMYGRQCQSLDTLEAKVLKLHIKKFIEDGLVRELELKLTDTYFTVIKRVMDMFKKIHPLF